MSRLSRSKTAPGLRQRFGPADSSRRPGNRARFQPRLEELDCRVLPSVVAVSANGGNVTITNSNPSDASLSLRQTAAGTITIADGNGFSVNGAAATLGPVTVPLTQDLTIKLNGGSDTASFDETTSIALPGKLEVDGTTGDIVQSINAAGGTLLSVAKDLNTNESKGGATVTLIDIHVGGNAKISNGDGGSNLTSLFTDGSAGSANSIAGDLQIQGGKGSTAFFTLGTNKFGGNVQFNAGDDGSDFFALNPGGTVGKDLNVNFGNGPGFAFVSGSTITGNAMVQEGDGGSNMFQAFSSGFGKDLNVKMGNGGGFAFISGSTITGNATVQEGDGGPDNFSAVNSGFGKDLNVKLGNGLSFAFIGASTISGNASIQEGDGNSDMVTASSSSFGKDLNIQLGKGDHDSALIRATTVGGNASVQAGDGKGDSVTVDPSSVGNDLNIQLGKGNNDSVTVSGDNTPKATKVGGNTNIKAGDGTADSVTLDTVALAKDLQVQVGDGADSVSIRGSFLVSTVGGNTQINTGDGGDTVTMNNTTFNGDVNVQTGKGADTLNIATNSSNVTFNGNVQANLGDGNDTLNLGATGATVKFAASKNAVFDGQGGTNTLNEFNTTGVVIGTPVFKNFQIQHTDLIVAAAESAVAPDASFGA
jgi:hypothetical protein